MGMRKTPHTGTYRGKRVRVTLKDGTTFDDRFWDRTKSHVQFKERGRVPKGDIRVMSIIKIGYAIT